MNLIDQIMEVLNTDENESVKLEAIGSIIDDMLTKPQRKVYEFAWFSCNSYGDVMDYSMLMDFEVSPRTHAVSWSGALAMAGEKGWNLVCIVPPGKESLYTMYYMSREA